MKAKIHRATVTQADLNYQGSISIDSTLMAKVGIREFEQVDVVNINNGERFTTYAISAGENSGEIKINGAAARKAQVGDLVIIISYGLATEDEAKNFAPKVIILNEKNKEISSL
jgi:aspartate 1-decarboxylase